MAGMLKKYTMNFYHFKNGKTESGLISGLAILFRREDFISEFQRLQYMTNTRFNKQADYGHCAPGFLPLLCKSLALCTLMLLTITAGPARADSMLTSPGHVEAGARLHEAPADQVPDGMEIDFPLALGIGEKGIGQLQSPSKPAAAPVRTAAPPKKTAKKLPSIPVRYRTYLGSAKDSKSKYGRHLSSRRGCQAVTLNITPIIIDEARKNGIPPLLLKGIIEVESGFNNYAVGGSGSLGLCQLMPDTARRLGVKDPFHPVQNIAGGAKYLGMLNKMYNGNIDRVIAGYNLGPGGVQYGVPSYAYGFIRKVRKCMHW
jgi:hypothetical protein